MLYAAQNSKNSVHDILMVNQINNGRAEKKPHYFNFLIDVDYVIFVTHMLPFGLNVCSALSNVSSIATLNMSKLMKKRKELMGSIQIILYVTFVFLIVFFSFFIDRFFFIFEKKKNKIYSKIETNQIHRKEKKTENDEIY